MKIIIGNGQFHTLGSVHLQSKKLNFVLFCSCYVSSYTLFSSYGVRGGRFKEHKLNIDGLLIYCNVFHFTLASSPAMHTESIMMV